MELKIKKSKDNTWGYVEGFKKWDYMNKGYVEAIVGITPEGKFTEPYIFRKDEFIPLSQIDEEMGIDKYIKAKKPFYSLLSEGFVVKVRAGMDFEKKEYIPEGSAFSIYSVAVNHQIANMQEDKVMLVRVRDVPPAITNLMKTKILPELGECLGDRELFLRNRMK